MLHKHRSPFNQHVPSNAQRMKGVELNEGRTVTLKNTTTTTVDDVNIKVIPCFYEFIGWFHITLLVLGILIVTVNLAVFIFIKTSRILKRNPGNLILMGLSLVDLLTGFHAVLHVIPSFYSMATDTCDIYLFSEYNKAGYYLGKICLLGSIGHLLLLAGERMIGLFRPIKLKCYLTNEKVIAAILLVWFISAGLPLLELTYQKSMNQKYYRKIHVTITIIGFWILPTMMLCGQYIAMLLLVYRFQRNRREAGIRSRGIVSKYKAFFIYLAMFLSYLISCSPYFAIRIIGAFFPDKVLKIPHLYMILRIISIPRFITSLLNPLMYAVFKQDFKKSTKKTLTRKIRTLKELHYVPSWLKHSSPATRSTRRSKLNDDDCAGLVFDKNSPRVVIDPQIHYDSHEV